MAIEAKAMTLGEILRESKSITIPRYQRPYKWERKLIEDIFEDVLMYGAGSRGVGGFMGSIVFCPGSDGAVDVVDGQQRLTTLTVMVAAVARRLLAEDSGSVLADEAFDLLRGSEGQSSRMRHKTFDRTIYEPLVSKELVGYMEVLWGGNPSLSSQIRAEALVKESKLYQAYQILDQLLIESLESEKRSSGTTRKVMYERLLGTLINKIILVRIKADEHTDGIRIFEALNTIGEPLTIEELVKSCHLMHSAKFGRAAEDFAVASWEDRLGGLHAFLKKDSDRDKYLRTYWLAKHGVVTKSRLYDGYAELLLKLSEKGGKAALAGFGDEIKEAAKVYSEMSATKGQWGCLGLLEAFGFEMHKVPLLALVSSKKYEDAQSRERLMRLAFVLEVVLIRMSLTEQSTAFIEKSFCTLAERIRSGQFATLPTAFERDVRFYFSSGSANGSIHRVPDDETFMRRVERASVSPKSEKWKLFALRLECEMKFPGIEHYKSLPPLDERKLERCIESSSEPPTSIFLRDYGFRDLRDYEDLKDSLGNFYFWDPKLKKPSATPFNIVSHKCPRRDDIVSASVRLAKVATNIWRV